VRRLLTIQECAARTNTTARWWRRAVFEKRIAVTRLGRLVRIDEIRLVYQPGEVADLKVMERAEEVASFIAQHPEGVCSREVREELGGRAQIIDSALARLHDLGRLKRSEERRPDKKGAQRMQVVWRSS